MRISDWSSDVCSSDLEIFAQGNVSLVDLKHDPIVRVVTSGIETASALIECDIIVFATGFDAGSGGLIDMKLRGTEGFDLGEAWKDGEIGRASCRESVCQYVSFSVVAVSLKKKTLSTTCDYILVINPHINTNQYTKPPKHH